MAADPWEDHAAWWQAEFTEGVDPEYTEQILPLVVAHTEAASVVLDLGCGEGQLARELESARGCRVVGVDPAMAQVAEARRRGGGPAYLQGVAGSLPLGDASVDQVVACLVVEHVAALDDVLDEVRRVLRPGGRFLLLLNHPLLQTPGSGWVDDHMVDPPEQYWQLGPYLPEAETVEQVQLGVFITFHHRPLSRYLNGAVERGLQLERIEEPAPPPGFLARAPEYAEAATIPRLLFLRFRRG
jgi:SAM-dependent methyltransferase